MFPYHIVVAAILFKAPFAKIKCYEFQCQCPRLYLAMLFLESSAPPSKLSSQGDPVEAS